MTYLSALDLMSNSAAPRDTVPSRRDGPDILALHRVLAGWMPMSDVTVADAAGATVALAPSTGDAGERLMVLPVDGSTFLTVEFGPPRATTTTSPREALRCTECVWTEAPYGHRSPERRGSVHRPLHPVRPHRRRMGRQSHSTERRRGRRRSLRCMTPAQQELFDAANSAKAQAHAPYSNYPVGAAVRTIAATCTRVQRGERRLPAGMVRRGQRHRGDGVGGEREIVEVLTVCDGELVGTCCGGCRQKLREFAALEAPVYACGPEGIRATFTLAICCRTRSAPSTWPVTVPRRCAHGVLPSEGGDPHAWFASRWYSTARRGDLVAGRMR